MRMFNNLAVASTLAGAVVLALQAAAQGKTRASGGDAGSPAAATGGEAPAVTAVFRRPPDGA